MPEYDTKAEMRRAKLTIHRMAELTGKNVSTVKRWRNGTLETPVYARTIIAAEAEKVEGQKSG